jgi:hypothetical protein
MDLTRRDALKACAQPVLGDVIIPGKLVWDEGTNTGQDPTKQAVKVGKGNICRISHTNGTLWVAFGDTKMDVPDASTSNAVALSDQHSGFPKFWFVCATADFIRIGTAGNPDGLRVELMGS